MGAWGTGHFDNDTALDWVCELESSEGLAALWQAVEAAMVEEYVDSDEGAEALAAMEVIASLRGGVQGHLPEEAENWLKAHSTVAVPENLLLRCREALARIASEESELQELWAETESYDEWKQAVAQLSQRLSD